MQLKNNKASAGLEKSKLPEGIIKFTITNQASQIVAERLFFNDKEDKERIFINTILDKQNYKQREKTILNIVTEDEEVNTIKTNLSVLVINKEQLGKENSLRSNILSYFLLNSELKGNIENPNYYFEKENKTRKQDIDALLLTQGWSNYKYEDSVFNKDVEFLPEKGLTISGTIKNQWFSKRDIKKPVELTAVYGLLNIATQQIDNTGNFKMRLEDYYRDEFRVLLQTKDEKEEKKDFTVDLDTYKIPVIDYKKEETVQLADSVSMYVKENIKRKQIEQSFKLAEGTIELEEVELTGYKMTPLRQKVKDLHGLPDVVIENKELLDKAPKWNYGLSSILESGFPDVANKLSYIINKRYNASSNKEYVAIRKYANMTFYLVDGINIGKNGLESINRHVSNEEIKSVEFLKKPKHSLHYINPILASIDANVDEPIEIRQAKKIAALSAQITIISVYTYAGKGIGSAKRKKGINKFNIQGFAPKREFYVPKYGNDDVNDWNLPDLRSVVHWSPNVNTDEFGEAKIEYYNADNTGEMLMVIEGITEKGKFGYSEISYTVEEK